MDATGALMSGSRRRSCRLVWGVLTAVASLAPGLGAADTCPTLLGRWGYGPAAAVAVRGSYAYLGSGSVLMIANIANPAAPAVVGRLDVGDTVRGVAVQGTYVYVAADGAGLKIVNAANPASPILAATVATPSSARGVAVDGSFAYVADLAGGLRVIYVANPASPSTMGSYDPDDLAVGVAVSDTVAYLLTQPDAPDPISGGLEVIDVSNPMAPVSAGFYETPGAARAVAISGSVAYVAAGLTFLAIDISDPANPSEIGFFDSASRLKSVAVSGDYAFVAEDNGAPALDGALAVVDIADPASPAQVGLLDTPGSAEGVTTAGTTAYLADGEGGLRLVDLSDPLAPAPSGSFATAGYAHQVAVSASLAVVADGERGVRSLDVSNPASPAEVGALDTPGNALDVAISGSYAYVADGDRGLRVISLATPANPVEVGSWDTPGIATAVAVSGSHAYLADEGYGLRIIDISNPANPSPAGLFASPASAGGVAVWGTHAFWASGGDLVIIDVVNPAAPTLAGSFATPGEAMDVAVSGALAFVADGTAGLRILDVSSLASPVELAAYDTPGEAADVAVSGGLAYVADGSGGVQVIDVSNPAAPALVGALGTPGEASGVALAAGRVYLAAGSTGLAVLAACSAPCPVLGLSQLNTASCPNVVATLSVTDGSGQPIGGLTAANFCLSEDGVPQSISVAGAGAGYQVSYVTGKADGRSHALDFCVTVSGCTQHVAASFACVPPCVPPGIDQPPQGTTVASGQPATLGVTATGTALAFQWYEGVTGDVSRPAGSGAPTLTTPPLIATTSYWVRVSNGCGVADSAAATVVVVGGACTGAWDLIVPAAAHTTGVNKTLWLSDVDLLNLGQSDTLVDIARLKKDQANATPLVATVVAPAGRASRIPDILGTLLPASNAALGIRFCGAPVHVRSRFYDTASTCGGTYGMDIPGMAPSAAVTDATPGVFQQLTYTPGGTAGFRVNIGFANASAFNVHVVIRLYGDDGSLLGTIERTLLPYEHRQLTRIHELIGSPAVSHGHATVTVATAGGQVHAYAMLIDNVSGDPIFMAVELVAP